MAPELAEPRPRYSFHFSSLVALYEALRSRKILVRYFDVPGLRDCLRITVGTPREIQALLKQMQTVETNQAQSYLEQRGTKWTG